MYYMLSTTGVTQGSVLAPFLFLIYVNNLPICSKPFHMIMYADVTTVCCDIDSVQNTQHLLNTELSKVIK